MTSLPNYLQVTSELRTTLVHMASHGLPLNMYDDDMPTGLTLEEELETVYYPPREFIPFQTMTIPPVESLDGEAPDPLPNLDLCYPESPTPPPTPEISPFTLPTRIVDRNPPSDEPTIQLPIFAPPEVQFPELVFDPLLGRDIPFHKFPPLPKELTQVYTTALDMAQIDPPPAPPVPIIVNNVPRFLIHEEIPLARLEGEDLGGALARTDRHAYLFEVNLQILGVNLKTLHPDRSQILSGTIYYI